MVLKKEVIKERLQHMKKTLDELKKMRGFSENDFLQDVKLQWSVERGLQLICEAVFDIGNHILVGRFNLAPTNYQDIIDLLKEKNIITQDLNQKFNRLGGFRNILVHDYTEVEPKEIFEKFNTRLSDFYEFIKEIVTWLQKV